MACRFAGGPVQHGQGRQAVAAQNVAVEPQAHNPLLDNGRGAAGPTSQAAGAVEYPRWTIASEASGPAQGGGVADLEASRGSP